MKLGLSRLAAAIPAVFVYFSFSLLAPSIASATSCNSPTHHYVVTFSGVGAWGTDVLTTTPSSGRWSAQPGKFSDIASWIVNNNNSTDAIEGGWYTGLSGNGTFITGLLPYYTLNNGYPEVDGFWDWLTANSSYHMTVVESTHTQGYVEIGWNTPQDWRQLLNYNVANGLNYSQAEVSDNSPCDSQHPCSWMGHGPNSFERMDGYFCNSGCTSWASWTYLAYLCNDAPYNSWNYQTGFSYGAEGPDT